MWSGISAGLRIRKPRFRIQLLDLGSSTSLGHPQSLQVHDGVTLYQFLAGREKAVRTGERTALSERVGRGQTSKVKNTFFVVRPPDLQARSSRWVKRTCGLWTTQGPKGNLEIFILSPHLISLSITSRSIKAGRTGFRVSEW